ncbi:histidine kinase [Sphingobacterium sp.]|uniref:sensor histidine kinase n=1 Tax=Sphingobacterium sp. TaxID=341027 RepID=UPI0031CEE4F0
MSLLHINRIIEGDKLLQFISLKKYRIWRHLSANTILTILFIFSKTPGEYEGIYNNLNWIFGLFIVIILFYCNLYLLTPKILFKGNLILYILSLLISVSFAGLISYFFHEYYIDNYRLKPLKEDNQPFNYIVVALFVLLPFIGFSTFIKFFQKWNSDNEKMHHLEIRAMESELEALRNQIQPHFLFNMLNSIKVLIKRQPDKAEQITLKLSGFLRHLLYENSERNVYLSSEIRFLDDYLSLEKMRRDNFEYTFQYLENEVKGVQLPPNILLSLIENAVKHSLDPQDDSYIDVIISVANNELQVVVTNSIPSYNNQGDKEGGIGLSNILRRLELIYGDRYYLNSSQNKDEYIAKLKLPI